MTKFSTEELLLAEAVRARVTEMRISRLQLLPQDQKEAFMRVPVDGLIAEALAELEAFATAIAQHRENRS
jgi:hypothetical protein